MNMTEILASFISNAKYEDLPEQAVVAAKRGLLDFLAVTIAGSREPLAEKLFDYAKDAGCNEEATVIAGGFRTSAALAALCNGAMSHALDYDDVIHVPPYWLGHPSVAIVPALLSAGEKAGSSGKDFILAYCIAMEVYVCTALYMGEEPYKAGWHNACYIGTIAAAAAAAKLLKLSEPQIRCCFGIAASEACGLRSNFGTMTKPLHAGIAARSGVEAAQLAARGFTANDTIFEARFGFHNVFSAKQFDNSMIIQGTERLTPEEFAKTLGNPWYIVSPGNSYKLAPSCRATHFGMEAGMQFRDRFPGHVQDIVEIECHIPASMEGVLIYHDPDVGLQGKFSLEYVLARSVLDGLPGIYDFTDEKVNETAIKELNGKIKLVTFEPPAGEFGVPQYIFKLSDGTEWSTSIAFAKGEPENPVDDHVLGEKYCDCAATVFPAAQSRQIREFVMRLDTLEQINVLTALLLA